MPRRSSKSTLPTTTQPATRPTITAAQVSTNGQGPLMATSPATMPLQIKVGSGRIFFAPSVNIAASVPATAAKVVLTITPLRERSLPESAHPAFKANQPKATIRLPSTTMGTWWPGRGWARPARYFPVRGPQQPGADQAR